MLRLLITSICFGQFASTVVAEESDVRFGRLSWSAFECSVLAGKAGIADEAERLFTVGYESGRLFITLVQDGTITREETRSDTPLGFTLRMGGPTIDFALGRVWEGVVESLYEKVFNHLPLDDDVVQNAAQDAYVNRNCKFLSLD